MASDLRAVLDRADRVVVFGDLHGDTTAFRVLTERAVQQMALTSVLISVGDFGLGPWAGKTQDRTLRRADDLLQTLEAFLLITPGNHDNWDTITEAITTRADELGFGILGLHGRIRVSPRGHRFTIGGRTFGSLGGAVSVDRATEEARRGPGSIAGKWWWPAEAPDRSDLEALGDRSVDVLITHDVPDGVPMSGRGTWEPRLIEKADDVRAIVREAVEATGPAICFCGHWHQRRTHQLHTARRGVTRVEVLSEENTDGNAVVLDLADLARPVKALPDLWRRWLDAGGSRPGTATKPRAPWDE